MRDEERIRRNIPENPTVTVPMHGLVTIPDLGDVSHLGVTHALVSEMYESIQQSAAVKYYEPTDWQFARMTLYMLNQELVSAQNNGKPVGAMKLTAINQMLSALLLTEGDRRRVRLEIERDHSGPDTGKVLHVTDILKGRLAAVTSG